MRLLRNPSFADEISRILLTGLEGKKELMSEFVDGDLDVNDQKMFKLLGLDVLDEKKRKVNVDDIPLPAVSTRALHIPRSDMHCIQELLNGRFLRTT